MSKLVSIVIPTWNRHTQLYECIDNIRQQTYKDIEIIIVSDGPDLELVQDIRYIMGKDIIQLGRNWSGLDKSSFGIAPLLTGYLMAQGHYIMPWCDDERAIVDTHIEQLVDLIETPLEDGQYPDFVYPYVYIWRQGNPKNGEASIIGSEPPKYGQITHYLFRPANFIRFGFPRFGTHPVDWSLIETWLEKGARYKMLEELTFNHPLDQT